MAKRFIIKDLRNTEAERSNGRCHPDKHDFKVIAGGGFWVKKQCDRCYLRREITDRKKQLEAQLASR